MKPRQGPTVATQHQNHTSFTAKVVGPSALWSLLPSIRMEYGIVQLLPLVHEQPALGASAVAKHWKKTFGIDPHQTTQTQEEVLHPCEMENFEIENSIGWS